MVLTVMLAVVAVAALVACIVLYKKYSASKIMASIEAQNASRLQLELERVAASGKAEAERVEAEWSRALDRAQAAAEEIREAEARAAAMRLDDVQRLNEVQIRELKTSYEAQIAELKESHRVQLEHEREVLGERFKALAADVLRDNSRQLDERSRASIEAVISPMKSSIEEFTKGYRECYAVENRDRLSLREEIRSLHELNSRVGREAGRLATALKGNTRVQGQWGEMVLANILEHSGLQQSRWFVTQESTTIGADGSRLRPDAVIHCPKDRDIIIDSKVSLTAYLRMLDADSDQEKADLAKAHLQSVENHIKALRDKDYQKNIGAKKGDFVLMFMPHEGAYLAAMNANPDLWMKAYDSHVVMVSPTHLVTVVHLVEQMWLTEDQTVNTLRIAEFGTKLLESLTAFLADLDAVGTGLDRARSSYENAVKRFTSGNNNVVRMAERLHELGLKSKKKMPVRFADSEAIADDEAVNAPRIEESAG
ncbi:MAG: DNA recombination protein RmuC [Muribaculaceae bacterium]|nr:DNA recombination protein RmuC [Muribaculaceae bacterium]